jgi:hypothetical protein
VTAKQAKVEEVVQPGGVEPPTYRSVVCRSIQLSYGCTRYCRPRPSCGTGILGHDALERNPSRPRGRTPRTGQGFPESVPTLLAL